MDAPIEWLLAGEPWIEYRTRLDLLGQLETNPKVKAARTLMLADPKLAKLLGELAGLGLLSRVTRAPAKHFTN
jgi:hypothetical protein